MIVDFSFLLFVFPVFGRNFSSHINNVRMIYEMKLLVEPTENSEISEPQMGFEPPTLRDLFGCSNH